MKIKWLTLLLYLLLLPGIASAQAFAAPDSVDILLKEAETVRNSDLVRAKSLAEAALEKARQQDLAAQQAAANKLLARLYAEQGNYVSAIEASLDAIRLFREMGKEKQVCAVNVGLGVIYRYQLQYDQSIAYYREAEQIALANNYDTLKAAIWGNMGNVFFDQQRYDEALEYHLKSLAINEAINDRQGLGNTYHNIGMIHRAKGDFEKAVQFYQRSLNIDKELGNQRNLGISYLDFTSLYLEKRDFLQALNYAEKAREMSDIIQSDRLRAQALEYLPIVHAALNNMDQAMRYFHEYRQLSDSLQAAALSQQIAEMQAKYDMDQKEKELSLQNLRIEAQQSSIRQQRLLILVLIAIFLPVLLIAYLLFNRYKLRQKNRQLQLENEQFRLSSDLKQQQDLDQMKSRFFANISHEFRTPLNLILAPLQQNNGTVPAAEADMMRRNAHRLLRLVNQLLDLARLEGGLMKLEKRNIEASSYIQEIANSFLPMAEASHIQYQIDIPERDYIVEVDPDKLEKIIYNLLSNAFKFTPSGGKVTIHLSGEQSGQLRIAVSDTGIGIPKKDQEQIFERFFQVDESTTRAYEGTGIGLALIKELVDLQQGKITVDSQEGRGSTFTVALPAGLVRDTGAPIFSPQDLTSGRGAIIDAELPGEAPAATTAHQGGQDLPQVLLVEDNTELRQYAAGQLAGAFQVVEARHGKEGWQLAVEKIPDLIVTDIMMPEMDGISLTKKLREDDRTSHIPILLLTARDDGATKIKGFETGAEQYLVKPFQIDELTARINSLLAQRNLLRQKFSREVILQPEAVTMSDRDAAFLENLIRTIEDNLENDAFSVDYLQRKIGMSRMQLHRKLKAMVDQSASEFIRTVKLKRAAQLLQQPGVQITEAAYQSGFNHLSYFAKCFKEEFGVSPSEYARNGA